MTEAVILLHGFAAGRAGNDYDFVAGRADLIAAGVAISS